MIKNQEILLKSSEKDREITFKELLLIVQEWFQYIFTKWIKILAAGLFGGAIGFCLTFIVEPVYTAETTFVLEEDNGGGGMLGQLGGLASLAGIDGGGGGGLFQGDNILQLYRSRNMIQKTFLSEIEYQGQKQLLFDYYIRFNKLREDWDKNEILKNVEFSIGKNEKYSRLQDSIMGVAVQTINNKYLTVIKPDKKLSIIKVEVKSNDEFFAKTFNDQIVKNVNDFYVQTKTKKALENLSVLQHQTDSVRNVLNGAIYTTAAVSDATPNLNPTKLVLRAPAQKSQFNAEANKAILTQLVQNLELAKLSLRKETPLIQVVDQPVFPLKKEKLGKAKAIILGGLLAGFLSVFILSFRRYLKTNTY